LEDFTFFYTLDHNNLSTQGKSLIKKKLDYMLFVDDVKQTKSE
jgi:hypothetical protein